MKSITAASVVVLFTPVLFTLRAQKQEKPPTEQQARVWQQERGWLKHGGGWPPEDTWQDGRAQKWSYDHRTWSERGGYGGYRIPQANFNANFGPEHPFRISRPPMSSGFPRFETGGYSFLLVDPWPEYWPDNWYDVNDLYIDYDEGYYLHNRGYAQVKMAITAEPQP